MLPIVLYGARGLVVDERAVARAGLVALVAVLAVVIASPVIACVRLTKGPDQFRPHFRQVAELADRLAGQPVQLYWGSEDITGGTADLFAGGAASDVSPLSPEGRAAIGVHGLVVVCLMGDAACRQTDEVLENGGARTTTVALTRSFLGFTGPPLSLRITVVPPPRTPARTTD